MDIEGFRGRLNPELEKPVNELTEQIIDLCRGKDMNIAVSALWNTMLRFNTSYAEEYPSQKQQIIDGANLQYDVFLHNLKIVLGV